MTLTLKSMVLGLLVLCLCATQALAAEVTRVGVSVEGQQTKVNIALTSPEGISVFTLKEGAPRIVIDIKKAKLGASIGADILAGAGGVKQVRYAVRGEGVRFVADLAVGSHYVSHNYSDGVLSVRIDGKVTSRKFSGTVYPRLKPQLPHKKPQLIVQETSFKPKPIKATMKYAQGIPVPRLKNGRMRRKARKPVIVIDPGHGGNDPGAIGATKVREEVVTLKAAQELRRQLLKTGKYEVVLTRTTDTYVLHEKRVRIARKAGADLFISLHADSLGNTETRGASVYTLADRAQKRGHNLVNTQNWILDVDLASHSGAVSDILVNLAQRTTLSKSAQFVDVLVPQLEKRTVLLGNTHRQASIYVLIAPDVPAVLLEMGFLSNAKDEKLLNSAKHRAKLMKSVTEAINLYFTAQTTLHHGP